ncbi:MAG: peptidoglycan -binding protein [Pseudomonadota bacterium]
MAFGRLSDRSRASQAIWPGFVDAMTALLLVLMFVLSIFMLVQFVLRSTITGQDRQIRQQEEQLSSLSAQLSSLSNVLAMEQARGDELEQSLTVARASLVASDQEVRRLGGLLTTLEEERDGLAGQIAGFEEQVAGLLAQRADLNARMEGLETQNQAEISAKEALEIALAQARSELDEGAEAARRAAAEADAMEALVASLEAEKKQGEARIADLQRNLSDEERARLLEAAAADALRTRLKNADAELTAMTLNLEERRREAEEVLTLLAAAQAERDNLKADLGDGEDELTRKEALLAVAQAELRNSETVISDQAKNLALLNEQTAELRAQLATLSAQLEASEAADEEQQVQISALGSRLNAALARELQLRAREAERLEAEKASLESYRSEFFGEMRRALGDRRDIRIVGDRFIFQSEVLFASGSASLGAAGRQELARLGGALREVIDRIPENIDWLLLVEGHTDNVPLNSAGQFSDNWELSQGRALSVVRYLSEVQNIPAERLAALGYGEYQPLDVTNTTEARARNRRIELKFAERPPRGAAE